MYVHLSDSPWTGCTRMPWRQPHTLGSAPSSVSLLGAHVQGKTPDEPARRNRWATAQGLHENLAKLCDILLVEIKVGGFGGGGSRGAGRPGARACACHSTLLLQGG